jgi:hypothetical protein
MLNTASLGCVVDGVSDSSDGGQVQPATQQPNSYRTKPNLHGKPFLHDFANANKGTSSGECSVFFDGELQSNVLYMKDCSLPRSDFVSDFALDGPKKISREEVVAFGGIMEPTVRGIRSSARIEAQPNADDTQLKRAMDYMQNRSAKKVTGMSNTSKTSLLTSDDIIARARSMGVSMGVSNKAEFESASLILDNEFQRSMTILKNNENHESAPSCLIVKKASNLCEDLIDEENMLDDDIAIDLPVEVKAIKKRNKKKSFDKAPLRRSTRTRFKKTFS